MKFPHLMRDFTFYTTDGNKIETIKAKRMKSGRGCYMDVFIITTSEGVKFKLPDYRWVDHYPDCDGESDRWDADIIEVYDEISFRSVK